MKQPICKLFLYKRKEAWYQLSQEEQQEYLAKIKESLESVGGKSIVVVESAWSSEQYTGYGVEEFPDIEAVQKHSKRVMELGACRYNDVLTVLGTKPT
jgi:hypothetical protein